MFQSLFMVNGRVIWRFWIVADCDSDIDGAQVKTRNGTSFFSAPPPLKKGTLEMDGLVAAGTRYILVG